MTPPSGPHLVSGAVPVVEADRQLAAKVLGYKDYSQARQHGFIRAKLREWADTFARHRASSTPEVAVAGEVDAAQEAIAALDLQALASAIHDARWDQGQAASSWVPFSDECGSGKVYCLRIANAVQMHLLAVLAQGGGA